MNPTDNSILQARTTVLSANKLIRNTYMLLSMTLLFSAATAGLSMMRLTEHPTRVFLLSTPGVAGEEGDQFDRFFRCR